MNELITKIHEVAQKSNQTKEQVEKELVGYLSKKYTAKADAKLQKQIDKLVLIGKHRIISILYSSTECRISEGWRNLTHVPSYHTLLWWALGQDPVYQGELFNRIVDELLADELIYTRTYTGDKEPKVVGLTEKGKMYWALERIK